MGKTSKKSGSDRLPDAELEERTGLVYRQSSLQRIDDAPEPSTAPIIDRHAVSAADILSQSLNTITTSDTGARSERNSQRSQSFTLHGSANNLLTKGGNAQSVTAVRRTTAIATTSSASQRSDKDVKRSIYAPKDLDMNAVRSGLEALQQELEETNKDDGTDPAAVETLNNNDDSSDSSDSYDANILGTGMDALSGISSFRLTKQSSSLSGKAGYMGSIADDSYESDYEDEDYFNESVTDFTEDGSPIACCGFHAPRCRLPVNRIASFLVRYAPCFWCFRIPISATDRTVLTRLNIISGFFAIGQMVSTAWLVIVMLLPPNEEHDEQNDEYGLTHGMAPNLWSLTGSMYAIGFFGGVVFISNLVTLKAIQVVNLLGAIRYLWVLLYVIPFEIFIVLSLIDFYNVTEVWIKHWWRVPSMAWFREVYCEPGTAGSLCMVPVYGDNEVASYKEREWCMQNYQATNCTEIRDAAQVEVEDLMSWFYNSNVAWGFVLIMILFLIVNTLERIISRPIVQKSRESNVPAWLSLPFVGSTIVGAVFRYTPSSVLSARSGSTYSWVGSAFMACGALFMVSAALGWFISIFSILSSRDKRNKHLSVMVFIFLNGVTCFILCVIFVASISYSVALVDISISPDQKHEIACGVDTADSCSNCDKSNPLQPKCPEWSLDDVTRVLQTQTKGSATLAVIFFLYSFSALRFGFVLRKHVTMYQIEYV